MLKESKSPSARHQAKKNIDGKPDGTFPQVTKAALIDELRLPDRPSRLKFILWTLGNRLHMHEFSLDDEEMARWVSNAMKDRFHSIIKRIRDECWATYPRRPLSFLRLRSL